MFVLVNADKLFMSAYSFSRVANIRFLSPVLPAPKNFCITQICDAQTGSGEQEG